MSSRQTLWDGNADPSVEYAACAADAAYFTDTYCIIDDSQLLSESGSGECRFRLWPAQIKMMWTLMTNRLVICLKARQLGISWVVCAFVLWKALFHSNQNILLFSKGQDEANELLRRIKALHERLPQSLKDLLPQPVGDAKKQYVLSNGSILRSLPATKTAGVGHAASVLVIDEAARIQHAAKLLSDAKPTIDAGGQMIIFSTANGVGGTFHSMWSKALKGASGFCHIFLPWWARPDRGPDFIEQMRLQSNDPREVPENYPANYIEAFVSSGRARFDQEWIAKQVAIKRDPISRSKIPTSLIGLPGLRLYRGPTEGEKFLITADPAEGRDSEAGRDDPDFCATHVLSLRTMEDVAVLHGRWESDTYVEYLLKLAEYFGNPEIVVERNNHGHAILALLKLKRYRKIANGHDGKPGWNTNEVTREPSINYLAAHLRDFAVKIYDGATLDEMQSFHTNHRGITKGVQGAHDDLVMSLAIGFGYLNHGLLRKQAGRAEIGINILEGYRG